LVGRKSALFIPDLETHGTEIAAGIHGRRFLVIGGAGSIGSAVVKRLFASKPSVLHVVDLSENNLVELVRDIRSTMGHIAGDFSTFAIDCLATEFDALVTQSRGYDYVLNFSAMKHVRSEKDPFTLMRLIRTNIFAAIRSAEAAVQVGGQKFFCVSTDKASNPVNMMGASKRIMELFLQERSARLPFSSARFANVAFSDGSLLHGFRHRLDKHQPIAAPNDVQRYFVTDDEAATLCLFSVFLGANNDIFFPKLDESRDLLRFSEIATRFLRQRGYEPVPCANDDEARSLASSLIPQKKWPCVFCPSDTTGEKDVEEFFVESEEVDLERFVDIGVVQPAFLFDSSRLRRFEQEIQRMLQTRIWSKQDLVELFKETLPSFQHEEKHRNLDQKM
jgi:FlaA1/EpsC-like NDP-sugar epimerase